MPIFINFVSQGHNNIHFSMTEQKIEHRAKWHCLMDVFMITSIPCARPVPAKYCHDSMAKERMKARANSKDYLFLNIIANKEQ